MITRHTNVGGVALAALAPLLTFGCTRDAAPVPNTEFAVPVRVATVRAADGSQPIQVTGMLAGRDEAQLSFKAGGVIARVFVRAGDRVHAGQVLAEVQPAEIDAMVSKARSAADQAGREARRVRSLYRDSVATLAQLEQTETLARVADADLSAAVFNRRHATIVAPSDGVVLARLREPNELVAPGAPVLEMRASAGGVVVHAGLVDRDAVRVTKGAAATVRFAALPDQSFSGRVTQVAAAADPATGTYRAEIALDARGAELVSGLSARVEIATRGTRALWTVPMDALAEADGDSATLYVVDAPRRRVSRRTVHIAFVRGDHAAIADASLADARVVVEGVAGLRDGSLIRISPQRTGAVAVAGSLR